MDWQYNGQTKNGQKNKQIPRKQYTENYQLRNTNPTKNQVWIQVTQKGNQFLFH